MTLLNRIKGIPHNPYHVFFCLFFIYFCFGFCLATPEQVLEGLLVIIASPGVLVTDYIAIAGLGPSLVNAGLVGMMFVLLLIDAKHKPTGYTIMTIWMATGFSFFGKNPVNVLPILLGGLIFAYYAKKPFSENILPTLLGTTLSPAVSQMTQLELPGYLGTMFGLLLGVAIGFIIEPIAVYAMRSHQGYNLYNVGFAAGILGLGLMALFRNFDIDIPSVNIWSSGNDFEIMILIALTSVFLIFIGFVCAGGIRKGLNSILSIDKGNFDYFSSLSGSCYINMGILALLASAMVLLIGVSLSGPIIGAVFTITGFGCCGKRLQNIIPVMLGAILAGYLIHMPLNSPPVLIAVLFSTCLSPISDRYGWGWGIVAGFLHLNVSLNTGDTHGGLNLYNNGLAGGFVVMILVPLIRALKHMDNKL